MSDQHIRILTAQARHSQCELDAHDAARSTQTPNSSAVGESSKDVPGETRASLAAARGDAAELRCADEL
jgi:hypothetical protein